MRASVIIAVAAVLIGVCAAEGAIVEVSLPCEGRYDWQTPGSTVDFDLGVQFSEISHVYIEWAGQIMAEVRMDLGPCSPRDPDCFTEYPTDVGLAAYIGEYPVYGSARIYAGEGTYPALESFSLRQVLELSSQGDWADLLDGYGSIEISYVTLVLPGNQVVVEHGYVDLHGATVIVEGTVVPEPTTLVMLLGGSLGMIRFRYGRANSAR